MLAPLKVSLPVPILVQAVVLVLELLEITPLSVRSPVPPMLLVDRKLPMVPLNLAAVTLLFTSEEVPLKEIGSAPTVCPLRSSDPPLIVVRPEVAPSAVALPSCRIPPLMVVRPVKVLAPLSSQVPVPDLFTVKTPAPLLAMMPLIVLAAVLVPPRVRVRLVAVLGATPFRMVSAPVLLLLAQVWLALSASDTCCPVVTEPMVTAPVPDLVIPLLAKVSIWLVPPPCNSTVPVLAKDSPSALCAAFRFTVCAVLTAEILNRARSKMPGTAPGLGVISPGSVDHEPTVSHPVPEPSQ